MYRKLYLKLKMQTWRGHGCTAEVSRTSVCWKSSKLLSCSWSLAEDEESGQCSRKKCLVSLQRELTGSLCWPQANTTPFVQSLVQSQPWWTKQAEVQLISKENPFDLILKWTQRMASVWLFWDNYFFVIVNWNIYTYFPLFITKSPLF